MKKLAILFIAATMALAAADAQAIDFKAKGIWQVGMGLSQRNFVKSVGGNKTDSNDIMNSRSRIRFQMDAVASESLSGSVHFEIGHIQWGQQAGGGALGADSTSAIKVRMAFMDWAGARHQPEGPHGPAEPDPAHQGRQLVRRG